MTNHLAIKVLEKYIAELPQLQLLNSFSNPIEASAYLQSEEIDLLFLDINMPKISGISLLKTLPKPPLVIFTTAYPEYAVEGFELEALDYLLKPFSLERFIKAINKATHQLGSSSKNATVRKRRTQRQPYHQGQPKIVPPTLFQYLIPSGLWRLCKKFTPKKRRIFLKRLYKTWKSGYPTSTSWGFTGRS